MKIERTRSFSDEFVLNEQLLRDIFDTLMKQMGLIIDAKDIVPNFKLKLQDLKYGNDGELENDSLTTILAEDNGDVWIIREFEIKIYDIKNPHLFQILLEFNKREPTPSSVLLPSPYSSIISYVSDRAPLFYSEKSIKYTIIGNDRDWVFQTSLKLEENLAKVRQFPFTLTGTFLAIISFFSALIFYGLYFAPSQLFKPPLGYLILAGFGFILLGFLGITFRSYFPPDNFCWGEYKKTFENKRSLGKTIVNLIIIGLVVSVIGSIIGTLTFLK